MAVIRAPGKNAAKNTALSQSARGIVDRNKSLGVGQPAKKAPVVKINSNPNTTPAKANKDASYASLVGQGEAAQEASFNTGGKAETPVVKIRTSGLTGREVGAMDHQGGHGLSGGSTGGNSSGVSIKYTK